MTPISINTSNGKQVGGLFERPIVQQCYTRGRKPYRASSALLRWRYFDSVEECLTYLRTKHPGLLLNDCEKIAFAGEPRPQLSPQERLQRALPECLQHSPIVLLRQAESA